MGVEVRYFVITSPEDVDMSVMSISFSWRFSLMKNNPETWKDGFVAEVNIPVTEGRRT